MHAKLWCLLAASFPLCSPTCWASAFVFSGVFAQDDNEQFFSFWLASAGTVTMQTWSFAGGTNADGQIVAPGGFEPVLSLFGARTSAYLLGIDEGGVAPSNCGPRNIDPSTGFCLDAYLQETLPAGSYTVVLTEYDNLPVGATLADGFLRTGQGDFTGPQFLGQPGSFILVNGDQRTDQWELDITGATTATQTPEPATAGLWAMGLAVLAGAGFWRKRGGSPPWGRRPACAGLVGPLFGAQSAPRAAHSQIPWLAAAGLLMLPLSGYAATASVAADTYISATNPTLNFGALGVLNVGGGNSALIQVNLSSLPAGLAASDIQNATLTCLSTRRWSRAGWISHR